MIRTSRPSRPDPQDSIEAPLAVANDAGRRPSDGRAWVGLEEASRSLGVSASTLRRWADAGIVRAFVTPGGHRRFDADSIKTLLPGHSGRATMEQLGETPERISRAYRRASKRSALPWVGGLDDGQRTAFREHGNALAVELLAALDAPTETDRTAHLAAASQTAAQYGVAAAVRGIAYNAMVQTFLQFRRPFLVDLAEVARRRGLDTGAATELVLRASDAFDQILGATMTAYDETAAPARGKRRAIGARALGMPPHDRPALLPLPTGMETR